MASYHWEYTQHFQTNPSVFSGEVSEGTSRLQEDLWQLDGWRDWCAEVIARMIERGKVANIIVHDSER